MDILAISETKVRGKGEWEIGKVKGFKSGGRRAKGGVAALFRKGIWKGIYEHKEIEECMMYVKLKVDGKILVIMSMNTQQAWEREERE